VWGARALPTVLNGPIQQPGKPGVPSVKSSRTRLILIAIAFIATLYALVPTFQANQLDSERNELAVKRNLARDRWRLSNNPNDSVAYFKDSLALAQWDSANGRNYRLEQRNLIAQPIKFGLDLQGGIYITMEVDIPAMLYESSLPESRDAIFEEVMAATRKEAQASDESVLAIFLRNFEALARPKGKALVNYFNLQVGTDVTDEAIRQKLEKNIEESVQQAKQVIEQRVNGTGVAEANIQQVGRRIILELPGVSDVEEVRGLLSTTARLEFKLVRNGQNALLTFRRIDQVLSGDTNLRKELEKETKKDDTAPPADTTAKADSTGRADSTAKADSTKKGDSTKPADSNNLADKTDSNKSKNPYEGLPEAEQQRRFLADHPFTANIPLVVFQSRPNDPQPQQINASAWILPESDLPNVGEYFMSTTREGMMRMKSYLARPEVRAVIPDSVMIAFSANPEGDESQRNDPNALYSVYVLTAETVLNGEVVEDASGTMDPTNGKAMVIMQMNPEGGDRWGQITTANVGKRVAVVLDSAVYSAPTVNEPITLGNSQITGSRDLADANQLAVILKAGALKAPVRIIETRFVGPSLGEDSIQKGFLSTIIATAVVFLFMLVYYRLGGLIADVALLFNIVITLALMAAIQATLTLPGIGGLVLTIGMAVDGNILIYERIREEVLGGKHIRRAVQLGYEKAWSAVLDTHITTIITGIILALIGTGPIRGFAVTLIMGLAATLFTSVFVTKTFFMLQIERGAERLDFGQPRDTEAGTAASARV